MAASWEAQRKEERKQREMLMEHWLRHFCEVESERRQLLLWLREEGERLKRGDFSNAVKAASLGMRHVNKLPEEEKTTFKAKLRFRRALAQRAGPQAEETPGQEDENEQFEASEALSARQEMFAECARTFTSSERSRAKDQEIRELERKLSEANRRNEQLEGQAQLAARQKELLAEQQAEVDDLQQQLLQSKHRAEQMEADALEALTAERRMKLEAREQAQLVANQSEQMAHQHAEEMAQQAATLAELHARLAVQQQAESMRQAWGNGSGPVAWAAPSFTEALRDHKVQLVANQSEQMAHQHAEEMAQQAATLAELHARLAVQQQAESMRQAWGNGSGPVAWAAPSFTEALRDHKDDDDWSATKCRRRSRMASYETFAGDWAAGQSFIPGKRKRLNAVAILLNAFVPSLAFALTTGVFGFSVHYEQPHMAWLILALALFISFTSASTRRRVGHHVRSIYLIQMLMMNSKQAITAGYFLSFQTLQRSMHIMKLPPPPSW
eukprot:g17698.t1